MNRSFESLWEEHRPSLQRSALSLARNGPDADDLLQITAIKCFLKSGMHDQQRSFLGWARIIMSRCWIENRRLGMRSEVSLSEHAQKPGEFDVHTIVEERSAVEVGLQFGVPDGTVKSASYRAKRKVQAKVFGLLKGLS